MQYQIIKSEGRNFDRSNVAGSGSRCSTIRDESISQGIDRSTRWRTTRRRRADLHDRCKRTITLRGQGNACERQHARATPRKLVNAYRKLAFYFLPLVTGRESSPSAAIRSKTHVEICFCLQSKQAVRTPVRFMLLNEPGSWWLRNDSSIGGGWKSWLACVLLFVPTIWCVRTLPRIDREACGDDSESRRQRGKWNLQYD